MDEMFEKKLLMIDKSIWMYVNNLTILCFCFNKIKGEFLFNIFQYRIL